MKYADEEAVLAMVRSLVEEARKKPDKLTQPKNFIDQHPWTLKYLAIGWSEAEELMRLAKSEGVKVVNVTISPKYQARYSGGHRMAVRVHNDNILFKPFIFWFRKVKDGYISLSG